MPEGSEGVTLINPFEVPAGEEEPFVAGWDRARAALADQRGYLGTRLHRSVDESDFRFVNVARWSSPLMFARATQRPEFREAAVASRFPGHPALYSVVCSGRTSVFPRPGVGRTDVRPSRAPARTRENAA